MNIPFFRAKKQRKPSEHRPSFVPLFRTLPDSVADEYKSGATLYDLGAKYNCSHSVIAQKLRSLGVNRRDCRNRFFERGGLKLSLEQLQQILELDLQDISHAEIARQFDVTRERIRQICLQAGHKRRQFRMTKHLAFLENRKAKELERLKWVKMVSELWKNGIKHRELAALFEYDDGKRPDERVQSRIGWMRKRYGREMFPYRKPNHYKIKK